SNRPALNARSTSEVHISASDALSYSATADWMIWTPGTCGQLRDESDDRDVRPRTDHPPARRQVLECRPARPRRPHFGTTWRPAAVRVDGLPASRRAAPGGAFTCTLGRARS